MLSIITAIAKNNVIGKDNKLIWHLPEDLKRFKEITSGKTIIMGRKTFESLGRILPNRKHVVISRNNNLKLDPQVEIIHDIKDLEKYINSEEEVFVIGGETIYKLLIPYCKRLYITKIEEDFHGDTFFPEIDKKVWKITEEVPGIKDDKNPYEYKYINYEKLD